MRSDRSTFHDLTSRTRFAFRSAKTRRPIEAADALAHDALVVATLDPEVRDILPTDRVDAIADLVMVDGRRLRLPLDQNGASTTAPTDYVAMRDAPIPLHAFLVWACRRRHVAYEDQVAILSRLREHGPTPLGDLRDLVTSSVDPTAAILGLACRDVVEIDLRETPGPDMIVRLREREAGL